MFILIKRHSSKLSVSCCSGHYCLECLVNLSVIGPIFSDIFIYFLKHVPLSEIFSPHFIPGSDD